MSKTNPMRAHFERTRATNAQHAKVEALRKVGARAPVVPSDQALENLANVVVDQGAEALLTEPTGNFDLRMYSDLQRLKALQAVHGPGGKVELKRELFPNYMAYIDGTLAVASPVQNDVLMHLMVWALDICDYGYALKIAEYALLNGLVMPAPYSRDVGNIFAEELAEALLKDDSIAQHADMIEKAIDLVRGVDLVDQVLAKLFKALGLSLALYRPKEAIVAYEKALRIDSKAGVKQSIDKLKRDLAKGNADPESPRDAPSGSQDTAETSDVSTAAPASTAPIDPVLDAPASSADASGA
jgi:tetratricopeptide (TPR) repeat protein